LGAIAGKLASSDTDGEIALPSLSFLQFCHPAILQSRDLRYISDLDRLGRG